MRQWNEWRTEIQRHSKPSHNGSETRLSLIDCLPQVETIPAKWASFHSIIQAQAHTFPSHAGPLPLLSSPICIRPNFPPFTLKFTYYHSHLTFVSLFWHYDHTPITVSAYYNSKLTKNGSLRFPISHHVREDPPQFPVPIWLLVDKHDMPCLVCLFST